MFVISFYYPFLAQYPLLCETVAWYQLNLPVSCHTFV